MKKNQLLLVFFLGLLSQCNLFAMETSDEDYYRVIILSGSDLHATLGKPIENLSVFAVSDGELEPIPYQFDEYNQGGAVYFDNWDEPIDGTRHIMDKNDQLLFLFGDSGERRSPHMKLDGSELAEIELTNSKGVKRYVYVTEGSRLQSDAQHVRYSIEESAVETDFFSLSFAKENHLIWKDFGYADYRGDSPIDGLKINFKSGVLTSATEMSFDNENFIARTVGENVGPIRTTIQLHLTFIFLGMEFVEASIQAHFYPNAFLYDVRLVIPETRRSLLVDPAMSIAIDFNELIGAQATTDFHDKPVIVDGVMSDREVQANGMILPPGENGLVLRSNRGFDLLAYLDWHLADPLSTRLLYDDNKDTKGESDRFVGQMPLAGYAVTDFPEKGIFGLVISVYLADYFKGTPKELSRYVRTSPSVKINQ